MNEFNVNHLKIDSEKLYEIFDFYKGGKPLTGFPVKWGMTFKKAGSMRFRWNEENERRKNVFFQIVKENHIEAKKFVPVELVHSKDVVVCNQPEDVWNLQKDGIVTSCKNLIPVITVADCVPIFFCDCVKKVWGVVHSGWKGTGIIKEAVQILIEKFNSAPEDILCAIGPHIHSCCYVVNEERACYFAEKFTPECVTLFKDGETTGSKKVKVWNNGGGKLFRLSLERANLEVLKNAGVKAENIVACDNCTCCEEMFGSNRRETCEWELKGKDFDRTRCFTVQAGFTINCE